MLPRWHRYMDSWSQLLPSRCVKEVSSYFVSIADRHVFIPREVGVINSATLFGMWYSCKIDVSTWWLWAGCIPFIHCDQVTPYIVWRQKSGQSFPKIINGPLLFRTSDINLRINSRKVLGIYHKFVELFSMAGIIYHSHIRIWCQKSTFINK